MYLNYTPEIEHYILSKLPPESDLLQKLDRETQAKILNPRMLSGHYQGRILSMISKMISPSKILEIGTYTGYSAICLAEGLVNNGVLHTIEVNEELENFAAHYFKLAGLENNIVQHIGDALQLIPAINELFDLVFIDADKENYLTYFHLVFPKLRKGGIIIVDNVLWSGKIVEENQSPSKETQGIIAFNQFVSCFSEVEAVIMPIRDGLFLVRKK